MTTRFKLLNISLNNARPFTCEPLNTEELFWPKTTMTNERRLALFNYKKSTGWEKKMFALVEHCGLDKDGVPSNPVVVEVEEE